MFKSILVTSLLALSIGLVGCGKTADQKAEDAKDKGNANVKVMTNLVVELVGVGIFTITTPTTESEAQERTTNSLKAMNQADLETALRKVKQLRSAAVENLNILSRDDVSGGDPQTYQNIAKNCARISKEIEALLAEKFKQQPAAKETEEQPAPKSQAIPGTNVA